MNEKRIVLVWVVLVASLAASGLVVWSVRSNKLRTVGQQSELNARQPAGGILPAPSVQRLEAEPHAPSRTGDVKRDLVGEGTARLAIVVKASGSHTPLEKVHVEVTIADKGDPIGSMADRASPPGRVLQCEGTTGGDGNWECAVVPHSDCTLEVWNESTSEHRYRFEVAPLEVNERRDMVVEIPSPEDRRIRCVVRARDDRRPISGAEAYLLLGLPEGNSHLPSIHSRRMPEAVSDANGLIDLWAIDLMEVCVEVRAEGFAPARFVPQVNNPSGPQEVLLDRGARLHVMIVGAGGTPAEGAHVKLMAEPSSILQPLQNSTVNIQNGDSLIWTADTSVTGSCEIIDLPAGVPLRALIGNPGSVPRTIKIPVVLEPGEQRTVQWSLASACMIRGSILDEKNRPVSGISVCALPAGVSSYLPLAPIAENDIVARATSGPQGQYEMPLLPPGRWWVGSDIHGNIASMEQQELVIPAVVEIPDDAQRIDLDLFLSEGKCIKGRVIESSGARVYLARVLAKSEHGSYSSSSLTDEAGGFTIGPVLPGQYRITATALGGVNGEASHPIAAGEVDVIVQLPETCSVRGLVVDSVTGEACSARVTAGLVGAAIPMVQQILTGKDGAFQLSGMVDGEWEVSAYTDDVRIGSGHRISVPEKEPCEALVIRVSAGARLGIRCEGNTHIPGLFVYRGEAIVGMTRIGPGENVSLVVPLGELKLHYWVGGHEQVVTVPQDRIGEQQDLVLVGM